MWDTKVRKTRPKTRTAAAAPGSPALRARLEEQLRFERLISGLSARFVRISSDELDAEITHALDELRVFFGCDRCALIAAGQKEGFFRLTHVAFAEGIEPVPMEINYARLFPWSYEMYFKRGEAVVFSRLEELPEESRVDWDAARSIGVKSNLGVPLFTGDSPRHTLLFQSLREERAWPDLVVQRVRLIGEIFVNALEHRRADKALRESEERLTLAAEAAEAGFWVLDGASDAFWVTPKVRELFQLSEEEVVSIERVLAAVHPEDRDSLKEAIKSGLESGEVARVEYRLLLRDGKVRWIASRGRACEGHMDGARHLMGASMDITERRETEQELQTLRNQLGHLSRVATLGELTATLSHELNQPLTAIRSNAQAALRLLQRENPPLAELCEILEDIVADDRRASEMIQRLRSVLKNGQAALAPLDLNELTREATALILPDILQRDVELSFDLAPQLPKVLGDKIQLQQVFMNLMLNALDAAREESARRLTVRTVPSESGEVLLAVEDSGPGIPEDRLAGIFEPFYTTKPEGLGMGLAICRSIARSHSGRLWAANRPGGGAVVTLALPACDPEK